MIQHWASARPSPSSTRYLTRRGPVAWQSRVVPKIQHEKGIRYVNRTTIITNQILKSSPWQRTFGANSEFYTSRVVIELGMPSRFSPLAWNNVGFVTISKLFFVNKKQITNWIERTLRNNNTLTQKNRQNWTYKRNEKTDGKDWWKLKRTKNTEINEMAQAFICRSPLIGSAVKVQVHDQELNYLPRY